MKGYGPEDIAITTWYLDRFKEVPDLYLCSYYFSYFAFNENKHVRTIYLLLWIYFYVNNIYLQIHHHHHVDMLCYKTLTTNMSSNIFNCCVYRAAADTLVNDFTWTHCASCLFNTAWFLSCCWLGWHFWHTHQTRANISQTPLHTVAQFPGNMSFNPETVGHRVSLNLPQILYLIRLLNQLPALYSLCIVYLIFLTIS